MSVVPVTGRRLDRPFPRTSPSSRRCASPAPADASRSEAKMGVRRSQARAVPLSLVVVRFALIAGVAYMASSLAGHVMVEGARNEGGRFADRAREARRTEAQLRSRINELTNLGTVETWAVSHGFLAPGQAPVASN